MGRATVSLGPFSGGLNNIANSPDLIGDSELVECVDFDYVSDGTLVTRPSVRVEALPGISFDHVYFEILGFYIDAGNISYTVLNIGNDLYYRANSVDSRDAGVITLIAAGVGKPSDALQYVDAMYFSFPGTSTGGAKWTGPAGSYTVLASMPNGSSLALFKERLWLSNRFNSRLYFSNLGTGDTWSGPDFADVNAGDGQPITAIHAGPSALYIFKRHSSFVLVYDSTPTRGSIQCISETVGMLYEDCLTEYEEALFILSGTSVYSLQGYTFSKISEKIDVTRGVGTDIGYHTAYSISTVGDRIIVSRFDKNYVYYPLFGTWIEWNTPPVGKWRRIPNSIEKYSYNIYITSYNTGSPPTGSLVYLIDTMLSNTQENDSIGAGPRLLTKLYPFDSPEYMKRLHWWGVDLAAGEAASFKMQLLPHHRNYTAPTWGSLGEYTVEQLAGHSWSGILNDPNFLWVTSVDVSQSDRRYLKAYASLRFTRIQFRVAFDGYDHLERSSINHLIVNMSSKQNPVSDSEGAISA